MDQAGDASDDWHAALRRLLLQQQQDGGSSSASMDADDWDAAGSERGSDEADSLGWQEVGGYASADAASRNSWKALYGPGALSEWGGSVSSSWDGGCGARVEGAGVLESPFAAVAGTPFPGEGAEAASDSMDTCWGSASDEDGADGADGAVGSSASSSGDSLPASAPWAGVAELSDDQLVRYGRLQPMSGRVLLQQMLSGMKLALTLSGRNEEALLVLRCAAACAIRVRLPVLSCSRMPPAAAAAQALAGDRPDEPA